MTVRIEKAIYGGNGLGRDADGRAVFVPYVLPGELVEIAPAESHDGIQRVRVTRLDEPSAQRTEPTCRHFGKCGGCQYQHASYELQLAMKADILSETLERAGLRNRPRITTHAGEPWGYRNRIRLRVEVFEGAIRFGYNLRDTREFLPIEECPIAAPVLWRAASALIRLSGSKPAVAGWLRGAAEIELFATGDEAALQVTLFLREERSAGFEEFCETVSDSISEVCGIGLEVGAKRVRMGAGVGWGRSGLRYVVEGKGYWVSRGGFFQVNRFLVGELVQVVTAGRNGLIAWDLFAGVGLFSRVLAEGFERVTAVEANATAVKDLGTAKVPNLRGLLVSVVDFLRKAGVERERPDLVVMDPPRAGVGTEVCGLLVRMQVPEIVYVSCDPTTLARDLRVMVDSGYDLAELHLVDLFPQTFHLETVAVLRRSTW